LLQQPLSFLPLLLLLLLVVVLLLLLLLVVAVVVVVLLLLSSRFIRTPALLITGPRMSTQLLLLLGWQHWQGLP
jgi:hypothetical protein